MVAEAAGNLSSREKISFEGKTLSLGLIPSGRGVFGDTDSDSEGGNEDLPPH